MKRNCGYTLLELTAALAILAVVTGLLIGSQLLKTDDEVLGRELLLLRETFYYLQHKALATGRAQEMTFDTAKNSYSYAEHHNQSMHQLSHPIIFGLLSASKGSPSKETSHPTQPILFSNRKSLVATIFPDGKISCGSVYLTNKARSCGGALTTPPHQFAHIRLYRWHNQQWLSYQA